MKRGNSDEFHLRRITTWNHSATSTMLIDNLSIVRWDITKETKKAMRFFQRRGLCVRCIHSDLEKMSYISKG